MSRLIREDMNRQCFTTNVYTTLNPGNKQRYRL